ncbi:adenosylcobinamide hydrolase [Halogranum amylolyticum]|uniref:Adenosylcobinamide hydrolase n=1 Tax=Halogranum amylolyticum TaxID=660520 RepID=A0A1H8VZZ4_9EURY|nr:adenosylcobinamide amidohydrolase [Halogranum amylolyticum]SEP20961.1 adenosylcobinamide hydrolase [Halogranum amylolyticum]
MFETTVRDGVCRLSRAGTRWLSTGYAGGESRGPAAYNVTVPEGWPETDLDEYVRERRRRAGFDDPGPTLLTGVDQRHARRARLGPVEAVVTGGVSNPATLPLAPDSRTTDDAPVDGSARDDRPVGTVNVVVGTTRSLAPGALANLLTVAAEAKTATLLATTGFTGTTTDAVVAACDPAGEQAAFSGSATEVGTAARACVRDALVASLDSRYAASAGEIPDSVADAEYGVVTDDRAAVSRLS